MACQPKLSGKTEAARLRTSRYGGQPSPESRAKVGGPEQRHGTAYRAVAETTTRDGSAGNHCAVEVQREERRQQRRDTHSTTRRRLRPIIPTGRWRQDQSRPRGERRGACSFEPRLTTRACRRARRRRLGSCGAPARRSAAIHAAVSWPSPTRSLNARRRPPTNSRSRSSQPSPAICFAATTSISSTSAPPAIRTSRSRGRRSRQANTCSARSPSPTTFATRAAPQPWPDRRDSRPSSGLHSAMPLPCGTCASSWQRGLSGHRSSSTATSKTRSGSIQRRRFGRSIPTPIPPGSRCHRSKATAHQSSTSRTCWSAPTSRRPLARCATSSPSAWSAPPGG